MLSDNEIAGLLNPLYRWSNLIFRMLIQVIKVKRVLKSFGWAWSKMVVAALFTGLYYWLHQEWIGELNWFIYANSGKLFQWFLGERGQKEAWQLDPTVKLEASSCNSTEDNAPPCVFFFTFFKLSKWHQIVQIHSSSVPIQQKLSDPKFAELLIITFDGIRSTMENISIWKHFFEKH